MVSFVSLSSASIFDALRRIGLEHAEQALKFLAPRRLVKGDAEMIGIDIAQVDALFLGAGKQRVGAAGRVNGHRIEEGFGGDFIAE